MAEEIIPPSLNSMVIGSNIILPSYSYVYHSPPYGYVFYTDLYIIDADSMSILTSYSSSIIYNKYIYPAFETILSSKSLKSFVFAPQFHTDSNIYFYSFITIEDSTNVYTSYIVTDLQYNFISSKFFQAPAPNDFNPMSGMVLSDTSLLLASFSTTYITDPSLNIQYSYQAPTDYQINSFCFDGTYIYLYLWNYDDSNFRVVVLNTELELITQTSLQSAPNNRNSIIFSTGENLVLKKDIFTPIAPMLVVNTYYFDNTLNRYVSPFYLYVLATLSNGENQLLRVYESPIGDYQPLFTTKNKKYINDWYRNLLYYDYIVIPAP